ncbi:hypothetical protein [Endozoicomonas sp.]|uniref:hypothetical protein n=1 Tax=Endozoicomonas sp. TaxID=1892382 RepID=UPI00383B67A0
MDHMSKSSKACGVKTYPIVKHAPSKANKVKSIPKMNIPVSKSSTSTQLLKIKPIRDMKCTTVQQFLPPHHTPVNLDQLFQTAKYRGFNKNTITTGYKYFNMDFQGYTYECLSEAETANAINKLSKKYSKYTDFNVYFIWKNACKFDQYVRSTPSIFSKHHDEIVTILNSAENKNDFQPLQWIQHINSVLEKNTTHEVAILAGLWVDFSILTAIDCDNSGLSKSARHKLSTAFSNEKTKFNWQLVPPLKTNSDNQPDDTYPHSVEDSLYAKTDNNEMLYFKEPMSNRKEEKGESKSSKHRSIGKRKINETPERTHILKKKNQPSYSGSA